MCASAAQNFHLIFKYRAATIQAETAGQLWAMDRQTFRRILLKSAFRKRKMYETLLDNVPMLKTLQVIFEFSLELMRQRHTMLDVAVASSKIKLIEIFESNKMKKTKWFLSSSRSPIAALHWHRTTNE